MADSDETVQLFRRLIEVSRELDAVREERDNALAAIARVRALCEAADAQCRAAVPPSFDPIGKGHLNTAELYAALEPVVVVADPAGQPAPSEGAATTTARTWQYGDPESGPEVLAVRDREDDPWYRCGDHWHAHSLGHVLRDVDWERAEMSWAQVASWSPLTDATGEVTP